MEAAQALRELMELSSQITSVVLLDADGSVVASSFEGEAPALGLASTTRELLSAAASLGPDARDVTRVEVELGEGAVFVVREGDRIIAATTGPDPTSGLVVYDLRTCVQSASQPEPTKRKRSPRKPKEASE